MEIRFDAIRESFDPERVPLAWRGLANDPRRLVRAAAGIGFAVFLMLMQLGFKNAFIESALQIIHALDGEVFLVSSTKYRMGETDTFPRRRLYQAATDPDVVSSSPLYGERRVSIWKNPESKETFAIQVLAFDPDKPVIAIPEIAARLEALKRPDTVLIDSRARRFLGTGHIAPGQETELAGRRVRVVGAFSLGPDFITDGTAVMGDRNFLRFFPDRAGGERLTRVDIGILRIAAGADPETVARRLGERLPGDVRALTKAELLDLEASFHLEVSNVGPIFMLGAVIGFLVGMLISYQILYTDIMDQLPQYATLKAIGYDNPFLTAVVLQQAACYGVIGFVPAAILAMLCFGVIGEVALLPMTLTPGIAATGVLLALGMCVAAGLVAVRRVTAADPAEVF